MGIEHKQLRTLISTFKKSGFAQLDISDTKVSLKLCQSQGVGLAEPVIASASMMAQERTSGAQTTTPENVITSKRVGHFFPLRTPQGTMALSAGDPIEGGSTIGFIESMNLRYEVKSDLSGVFERYLIDEGDPVEYGQALVELQ